MHSGAIHGIIGPEGAGKTTLLRHIVALLSQDQGKIEFKNDNRTYSYHDLKEIIAYMPEKQSLYADLSISEHLQFFKALYQLSEEFFQKRSTELLHLTRLANFMDRPAGKLSGGMYKKLGLMCALLQSPKILLLDEPTNGVDPISRREFWDLLYQLKDQNILIAVTTAYMDEAERCTSVHLMNKGAVLEEGPPLTILNKYHAQSINEVFCNLTNKDEA